MVSRRQQTELLEVDSKSRPKLRRVRDVERDTDGDGAVTTSGIARVVTALPDAHEWQTVLAPPRDIVLVTRELRAATARSGAVSFQELHSQGDIKLALTGFALPSLADASVADFLGVAAPTVVELEGITGPGGQLMRLPSSLTILLGDNPIHPDWTAFGDGALAWSFGVQVPLAEVGPLLTGVASGSFGPALRQMVPFLARGDHFVGLPVDVVTPSTLTAITQELAVPAHDAPDTLGIAFARVAGGALVPLGIGVDGDDGLRVDFAPPHDGLEGSAVVFAVVALDLDALTDPEAQVPMQMVTAPLGDELPPFVPHLEGTFDGVAFASTNDPGADLYRVRFGGWTVWSAVPPTFSLDELHAGAELAVRSRSVRAEAIAGDALGFAAMQELDSIASAVSSRPVR